MLDSENANTPKTATAHKLMKEGVVGQVTDSYKYKVLIWNKLVCEIYLDCVLHKKINHVKLGRVRILECLKSEITQPET